MAVDDVAEIVRGLTAKARAFLSTVGIASWWRTEEGERVPSSLIRLGLVQRAEVGGIDFLQYRLTPLGLRVRDHLKEQAGA